MRRRETSQVVTFVEPFVLRGHPGLQPAGRYMVEMEEALIDDISFPAHRHACTKLTRHDPLVAVRMMLEVRPEALETTPRKDTSAGGPHGQPEARS